MPYSSNSTASSKFVSGASGATPKSFCCFFWRRFWIFSACFSCRERSFCLFVNEGREFPAISILRCALNVRRFFYLVYTGGGATPPENDLQLIVFKNSGDLATGVSGPGGGLVQTKVGSPVVQRFAVVAGLFVGQCQIIVGVGVRGSELQRRLIDAYGFLQASSLVENVGQVEISQGISRIDLNRLPVVCLCLGVVLHVV